MYDQGQRKHQGQHNTSSSNKQTTYRRHKKSHAEVRGISILIPLLHRTIIIETTEGHAITFLGGSCSPFLNVQTMCNLAQLEICFVLPFVPAKRIILEKSKFCTKNLHRKHHTRECNEESLYTCEQHWETLTDIFAVGGKGRCMNLTEINKGYDKFDRMVQQMNNPVPPSHF